MSKKLNDQPVTIGNRTMLLSAWCKLIGLSRVIAREEQARGKSALDIVLENMPKK